MAMAKSFAATGRRRGNPNWGRPAQPAPVLATEFETQVQQLGLTKQNVRRFDSVTKLVRAQQKSVLYTGMVARCVGNPGGANLQRRSAAAPKVTTVGRGQNIDCSSESLPVRVGRCSTYRRNDGAAP